MLPPDDTPDTSDLLPRGHRKRRRARRRARARGAVVGFVTAAARSAAVAGVAVASLVASVSGYAYVFGISDGSAAGAILSAAAPLPTTAAPTTTIAPTTTTTIPRLVQPEVVRMPDLPGGSLSQGDTGDVVAIYEVRLKLLRFDPGPVDGRFDQATRYAVEAVEKLLGWERDGVIDAPMQLALSVFQYSEPLVPGAESDRVEISLDRQVLTLYKNSQVELITTTSTGNGKKFCGGSDGCQYAVTPPGRFEFTWHHRGWRQGKLGRLYSPWYFNGGIAIHGYASVPAQPASHGCSRIPMHIAEYFSELVHKGMPVYVVGTPAGPVGVKPPGGARPGPPPTPPTDTTTTSAPDVGTASTSTTSAGTTTTSEPSTTTVAPTTTVPPTTSPPTTSPPTTSPPTTAAP